MAVVLTGLLVAVVFAWWGQSLARRRWVEPSDRMSEAWMKEHLYDSGKHGDRR
jgi:ABC-type Mn2+/Zn2+ transport system permease subunit